MHLREGKQKIVMTLNEAQVPSQDVVEVLVSPSYVFLPLSILRPDSHVAAQNCWVKKGGPSLVNAELLVNLDIPWFVGDKVAYALAQGLKTLEQREAGSTMDVVAAQTKLLLIRVSNWSNVVIAYEPVWAIGPGKVASPAQAQEVHDELRKWLAKNVSADVAALQPHHLW
ncbi:LOW QUALITY PROTEIN: hypothetical protein HID58_093572, partial [Brassica napus]